MKVVSLIDNQSLAQRKDLRSEHGLSIYIYTSTQQILFDTGVSGIFRSNAQRLNTDLAQVSLAVLSHHHYDHGGGLRTFFASNTQAKVYLRSSGTEQFYLHLFGLFKRPIGLDATLFQDYPERFCFTDVFSEIAPDVFIVAKINKRHPSPRGNRRLFVHTGRSSQPEDFEHELILVIRENGQLVVFTGCSHHGILNMLDAVLECFPGQTIKAVFGGFHLIDNPPFNTMAGGKQEVEELGEAILKYPIEKIFTGHCTGAKAYQVLSNVMGEKMQYLATGCQVEI